MPPFVRVMQRQQSCSVRVGRRASINDPRSSGDGRYRNGYGGLARYPKEMDAKEDGGKWYRKASRVGGCKISYLK